MSINQNQIPSSDFIQNEINTLSFIKGQTSVANSFPELYTEANRSYNIYLGRYKNRKPTSFEFGCELKLKIQDVMRSLFVEATVQQNYAHASYALSICDSDAENRTLIRKFHFDYDPVSSLTDKKPKYHLQYGGKKTPKLNECSIAAAHLHDWLSVPRLSVSPINLALLLDIVFNEFQSEGTKRVIETSEWRDMIKDNESKILMPYYISVGRFLNLHKSNHLFRDFFYGE